MAPAHRRWSLAGDWPPTAGRQGGFHAVAGPPIDACSDKAARARCRCGMSGGTHPSPPLPVSPPVLPSSPPVGAAAPLRAGRTTHANVPRFRQTVPSKTVRRSAECASPTFRVSGRARVRWDGWDAAVRLMMCVSARARVCACVRLDWERVGVGRWSVGGLGCVRACVRACVRVRPPASCVSACDSVCVHGR